MNQTVVRRFTSGMKRTMHFVVVVVLLTALSLTIRTPNARAQTVPALDIARNEQFNSHSGFPRYHLGSECAHSLTWTENQFWRSNRPDTISYARSGNLSQRVSVDAVKQCVMYLDSINIARRDLLGLGQSYLAAEQYDKADATLQRLAALVGTEAALPRAWTLSQIVDVYLGAAQPKLAKAEHYVVELDAIGAPAAVERMLAHRRFAEVASGRDSVALRKREIYSALRATQEITGDDRKQYAGEIMLVYFELADFQARMGDAAGAITTLNMAKATIVPLRPSLSGAFDQQMRWYARIGGIAPKIRATQWFNRGDDTTRPVPDKINLIVFVSHSCHGGCYPGYGVLRRLVNKFGNTVEVTLVARTQGYYRNQLVAPDSEFVKTRDYFLNYLKLPGALAIWRTDFGHREDGRLIVKSAPNDEVYQLPSTPLPVFIVDRSGIVRFVSKLYRDNNRSHDTEAILEDEIASLL